MYRVGIVTLSDKGANGERKDLSGPKIQELLPKDKYEVISYIMLPDDREKIRRELLRLSDEVKCDLVLTTGGTGFSPRDITPEATMDVAERSAPGIAEGLRAYSMQFTKRAILGRGVSVHAQGRCDLHAQGGNAAGLRLSDSQRRGQRLCGCKNQRQDCPH